MYGDSAFASVQTAMALLERSTYFVGMVKTAHKGFPKKVLLNDAWDQGVLPAKRGDTRHVEAEIEVAGRKRKFHGHAWNEPGGQASKRKALLSTCGDTLPADPHRKKRLRVDENNRKYGEVIERVVPRPNVVKMYFGAACQIDIHNHMRQGVIGIEDHVGTNSHIFRLFSTIVAMSVVDAYKMYHIENKVDKKSGIRAFVEAASVSFLTNREHGCPNLDVESMRLRRRNTYVHESVSSDEASSDDEDLHQVVSIAKFREKVRGSLTEGERKHGIKLACRMEGCKEKSNMLCIKCSTIKNMEWAICGPGTHRNCIVKHQKEMLLK